VLIAGGGVYMHIEIVHEILQNVDETMEIWILPLHVLMRHEHCRSLYNNAALTGTLPAAWGSLTLLKEL
jgi:hypothetical protein